MHYILCHIILYIQLLNLKLGITSYSSNSHIPDDNPIWECYQMPLDSLKLCMVRLCLQELRNIFEITDLYTHHKMSLSGYTYYKDDCDQNVHDLPRFTKIEDIIKVYCLLIVTLTTTTSWYHTSLLHRYYIDHWKTTLNLISFQVLQSFASRSFTDNFNTDIIYNV